MAITVYCARCARTISGSEMEDGLVVETERGFFCAECARYVKGSAPPAEQTNVSGSPLPITEESSPTIDNPQPTPEEAASEGKEQMPLTPADDPIQLLQEIRDELRPITRAILYEKSSIWNLLGGIGQIFALALVLAAVISWNAGSTTFLLGAILVQLVTLTCFLRGK